uniref:SH3 and multiple ankyrin repeat domains protein 3-like n=1 Tax=Sinocyclocheilus anshuiensis TaxID=1608454 RepID=A0A671K9I3_9TELE
MVLESDLTVLLSLMLSDYIIEEKNAVLQKKENEGFGFVLRGAKAETPIEEFTPTPAFPALQYLESVDVEGVAWRAGLRTGDFLIEVNGVNVVKVGHKQVVSLIRQGGNNLLMKVVSVTRKPESEESVRKKAPPPPKRAPSTTLTLRSKSMTAELEELGKTPTNKHMHYVVRLNSFSKLFSIYSSSKNENLLKCTHPQAVRDVDEFLRLQAKTVLNSSEQMLVVLM